jgi:predicted protein tyrosine phosphatase
MAVAFKVLRDLHQGGIAAVEDSKYTTAHRIQHVVSVGQMQPSDTVLAALKGHMIVAIFDSTEDSVLPHLAKVLCFIHRARLAGEAVLVHCSAGRSRSAAFVIAYLMTVLSCSYDTGYSVLSRVNPHALPNPSFVQQLETFHSGASETDLESIRQMLLDMSASSSALMDTDRREVGSVLDSS